MNIASPSISPVRTNRRLPIVVAGMAVVALALFAGGYTLGAKGVATRPAVATTLPPTPQPPELAHESPYVSAERAVRAVAEPTHPSAGGSSR